ncbi:MAG TPA: hypothetical protein VM843_00365, partial [Flavisolibacter sp.]|nr:hypothetical protein [Flavisolibacter sp.]
MVTVFLLLHGSNTSYSQPCTTRFASIVYRKITFDTFTCAVSTNTKGLVGAGNIIRDHGFITKFSSQGTPLFSFQYNPVYQNNTTYFIELKFTDITETKDGAYLAAGHVIQDRWRGLLEQK